jgi:hypothetical protein
LKRWDLFEGIWIMGFLKSHILASGGSVVVVWRR